MAQTTINDVARTAGVSIKTVSRVVNREPNVRPTTRERVNKAISRLNYRPNQYARNLARHRARLISLVYDDPSAYDIPSAGYVVSLQQGVLNACKSSHYDLLIHPCNYRDKQVELELKTLIEHARPDGVVLAAPLSNMPKLVRAIAASGTSLVRLSPGQQRGKHLSVATNDREISAGMVHFLVSLGHRRIAFITGHPSHKAVCNRFLGYREGLQQNGITFSDHLVVKGDNSIGSGEAGAARLLQRKHAPSAIFAANDDMAAGVIRIADRLGIDVPGQLSVAGFDDIPLARQVYPALTTIEQPLQTMAERAALALIEGSREGESPQGTEIIPARLRIRESTGPVAT